MTRNTRTVAVLRTAGDSAARRGDHRAAAALYTRALDASGGAPDVVDLLDRVADQLDRIDEEWDTRDDPQWDALVAFREAV